VRAYSGQGCDAPPMPYKAIEQWVLFVLMQVEEVDFGFNKKVVMDPLILVRGELDSKKRLVQKMVEALQHAENVARLPTLVASMTKLEDEIAGLEKHIRDFVPPRPTGEVLSEAFDLFNRHKDPSLTVEELFELRQRLQSALKLLISKIVLFKTTMQEGGAEYRTLGLYGPVVEHLKNHSTFKGLWMAADDGGLDLNYTLPAWGINGTRRRGTAK
jgi:hypothetical protein